MTDDLNERTALAMGWTFITFPDGPCPEVKHWKKPDVEEFHWRPTPWFATDPATIPEMLAWLSKCDSQFERVDVSVYADEVEAVFWDIYGWNREGKGDTLNEALARLVCAVAEAKRGQEHGAVTP